MKSDLDRLMKKYNVDVIFVIGGEEPNMIRNYLLNGAQASAQVIKKQGEPAVVIANPMEKEIAARSGLQVYTLYDFGLADLQKQYKGDTEAIQRESMISLFKGLSLQGRVAFFGTADIARFNWLIHHVFPQVSGVEIVSDFKVGELFGEAYATKDTSELEALKEAGRLSSAVVAATWDYIASHRAAPDGTVVDANGKPLTVGDVKRFVIAQNLEKGLENADGMIFAPGREGATGHGEGQAEHVIKMGDCIVFDYFPRSTSTGYFHDMTRTWSIGYARPEVQKTYDQVMNSFNIVVDSLKVGDNGTVYQNRVNEYFESLGHKTSRSQPGSPDGYFHSLGHGLGLNVHELPGFRNFEYGPNLSAGSVFTIEPGLYYPDQDFGVRIEDTVYFDENGVLQNLTDFKYDLVLPIEPVQ
jgi:Xaa-Pro aminopeptidase